MRYDNSSINTLLEENIYGKRIKKGSFAGEL